MRVEDGAVSHFVTALGVVVWPMVQFEADDALATATARFEHLESIPIDATQWKSVSVSPGRAANLAESLSQRRDEAYLFRTLATLRVDVPLKETINDLKWQGAYPRLKKLCHELGDDRTPERVPRWQ